MIRFQRLILILLVCALVPSAALARFFPYEIQKKTLENGLDVIVIETPEFKDVVNWNTLILAGSRNEIEEGRSGLAHLFEHIAFRHKFEDPSQSYDTRMEKIGAFDNAWTWFDVTYYHPVTFKQNLEELAAVQAERFVAMDFSERIYRTEAGAVLGEYRRIASDPSLRMDEVLSDLAFGRAHGYGHTTIGYLSDVENMPSSYRAGKEFYERWYRPNNAVVIVSGDVKAEEIFALVEKTYGSWERGPTPDLPDPQPIEGPKSGHVPWHSDVPPRMIDSYLVPAFQPGTTQSAVVAVLPELLGGQTAPLFQKLRYEKKVATSMFVGGQSSHGFDDRLLEASLRLDKDQFDRRGSALFRELESDLQQGFEELKNFSSRPNAEETLQAIKSKYRYDLLSALDSAHDIAQTFAWYYRFGRDVEVLDRLVESVDRLTPRDIDQFARTHFVPSRRVVVTMSYQGAAATSVSDAASRRRER